MPAYLCRELASAAGKAPLRFYPLDDQLSPDTYFLRSALGAGDLIVVIDYFGWPPSKTLLELAAEQHEVIWVEDRAHCLWTQDPPWAPWVLYSPRKLVGVPDGGILVGPKDADLPNARLECRDGAFSLPELMRFEDVGGTRHPSWYAAFQEREASLSVEALPLSHLTAALLQRIPLRQLVEARQRNFAILAELLSPHDLLHRSPSKIAPFGFVIKVDDAASLAAALATERFFCARHWADLASDATIFPKEHALSRHLLTLPCDHRYEGAELIRLADTVRRLIRQRQG